ncbi:MAG: hypothetical protein DCE90_05615 [Pseudanabaena sp.]|nr:MAG: hypothetical protein DCE90_05615 [Pseudanabaena sp.]
MSRNKDQSKNFATVSLSWLRAEQGGRKRPIGTADYAATAYFTEENVQLFSIILHFPAKIEGGLKLPTRTDIAEMNFLISDCVAPQLKEGMRFHVTEGGRVVADGEVLSVKLITRMSALSGRLKDWSQRKRNRVSLIEVKRNRLNHPALTKVIARKNIDQDISIEYEEFPIS